MEIIIHDKRKVHEIQKNFSEIFPNLKVEFFAEPHHVKRASHNKLLMHPDTEIGECRAKHTKGSLSVSPKTTAAELKKGFNNTFGLCVQVYRKVGDNWLEAAVDVWPLEKQNAVTSELNSEGSLERI